MDLEDDNSVPDCSDFKLGGDGIKRDRFIDHPPLTQLEFDDFDEDVPPVDELPEEVLPSSPEETKPPDPYDSNLGQGTDEKSHCLCH